MNRWRAAVLVAVVLAGCGSSPAEGHPLDDLDAAARAHVLPHAVSLGARAYVCDDTDSCARSPLVTDAETWVEVTELRSRTLRFSRVLAGPALRSPLHIVIEPAGRPDEWPTCSGRAIGWWPASSPRASCARGSP
jgi:hypothetical protein